MWTGNKPPLLPKTNKKESSSSSPTRKKSTTPAKQNAELEALRQRGLTTLLNRHFTETTRQVAAEKAAADAALRDLEARRAQTGEFKPAGNTELSPLDALYVSVNQWRADCRRKEKETVLLYQRYVNKFGDSGHVQVPATPAKSIPEWATHEAFASPATANTGTTPQKENLHNSAASKKLVSNMKQQIEAALNDYLEKGGLEMPSMESLGKDKTFQQVFRQHQTEFQKYYLRQREQRGIDAKTKIPKTKEQVESDRKVYVGPGAFGEAGAGGDPLVRTVGEPQPPDPTTIDGFSRPFFVEQDFDDDDDRSIVSGLTTLNSAETRRILQDCEKSVATFLQEEHKAIRQMMLEEDGDEDALTRISSSEETMDESVREAEHMVQQMKGILNDFTKQKAVVGDSDDEQQKRKGGQPFETSNKDEDWVVYYDETMKRDYYHERNTNRTQWEPPDRDATSASSTANLDHGNNSSFDAASNAAITFEEVRPDTKANRYKRYRRQRRRSRRRRRVGVAAVTSVLVVLGAAYYHGPKDTVSELPEGVVRVTNRGVSWYASLVGDSPDEEQLLQERVQQQLVHWTNAVFGLPQPVVPVGVMNTEEGEQALCELDKELFIQEVVEREVEDKATSTGSTTKVVIQRPWVCHIPLAYLLNPQCRALANRHPLFDLQALITSMMQ